MSQKSSVMQLPQFVPKALTSDNQGIIQSMNRKGVMNDNAEIESFFHNFKAERIHRNAFTTERELRAVIHEYVGFYNEQRLHSSLGYISPAAYEVKMAS